jgi:hypothetical protein
MALTRFRQHGLDSSVSTSEISTFDNVFSNYNTINSNGTITTESTKNAFLLGPVNLTNNAVLTVTGDGTLRII